MRSDPGDNREVGSRKPPADPALPRKHRRCGRKSAEHDFRRLEFRSQPRKVPEPVKGQKKDVPGPESRDQRRGVESA